MSRIPRIQQILWRLVPARFVTAYGITLSGQRFVWRAVVGLSGLAIGGLGIALALPGNWPDVIAGALIGLGTSLLVWAVSSYRSTSDQTRQALRETAEVDLLHARLNQIARRVGAPTLELDWEFEHAIQARIERLAHYSGLEEFRAETHGVEDDNFWTEEALGESDHQ